MGNILRRWTRIALSSRKRRRSILRSSGSRCGRKSQYVLSLRTTFPPELTPSCPQTGPHWRKETLSRWPLWERLGPRLTPGLPPAGPHWGEALRMPDCAKGFSDHLNLRAHQRLHTGKGPYRCGGVLEKLQPECKPHYAPENAHR